MKRLCILLTLLAGRPALAGWTAPVPPDKLPAFNIPRMAQPPAIDGVIGPDEWREATAVSGIGGATDAVLIARPTTYYLAWDPGHLYMAMRTWVRPGYKPNVSGREPGAAVTYDDGCEFHFQPLGKNVAPGRTSSSYKFDVNCLGFGGDTQRVAVGQQFKNWSPRFRIAAKLTAPGSAPNGGRWWECEFAAAPEDFELAGPNQAGDQWKLMLGFNHMYSGWTQARIAAITSYFDPGGYPVGTLVENAPAVQMTMDDLPGPCDGVAAAKIRAYNPTGRAVTLNVLAEYADDQGADLLKREQALAVPAGRSAEFALNEKLPRAPGDKPGTLFFRVTEGNREIYRYFTRFTTKYPKEAMAPAEPPKRAFPLQATFNPARSNLMLVADSYYLDDPATIKEVRYQVRREGASDLQALRPQTKPVASGSISRAFTYYYRRLVALPALPAGKYQVEAAMLTRDGKRLGPVTSAFEKLDEAKAFPEWWNTKLGSTERLIKPFTPVTRAAETVSLWGRQYRLDALGLPAAVVSQGKTVSAAPARVLVTAGGKTEVVPLAGAPRFTEGKPWRVRFTGRAKGAGILFTAEGSIEQDGLAMLSLTYAPAGRKPVKVDSLRLEFPLSPGEAECLVCLGSGGNYAARTTMLLPAKQGRLWSTLDTGRNGSGMTVGSFYPCVWVGNEQRGLLWWADNDRGWVPDDAVPAHEVIRRGGQVFLRNNLIGRPFALAGARTVTFSYMASPFHPMAKGWRASIHSEDGTFEGPNKEQKDAQGKKVIDGWCWLTPPSRDPKEWGALWAGYKKIADEKIRRVGPFSPAGARNGYGSTVHTSLPLMGYGWKSPDERVTDYFGADWEGDSWNKSEQDYFLWVADRAFGEGGLRTIYWDIFFVNRFNTLQNGMAYALPDGRIQPGFNGWNIRRFMMRMYGLMGDHGLTPGSQVSHATNDYCLVACGWMDAILDGEYHSITDDSGMDWVDGYPIERMRAMSVSGAFGPQISWMHLMSFKDKAKEAHALRGFIEYPRLYDSWCGPNGTGLPEPVLDWGLNQAGVQYVPFWRNPFVSCADKEILVSLWRLPDRVAMVVFNYNRTETKDALVKVDLQKLNLLPQLPWQEFIGVRDLDKAKEEPASSLDYYARTLKVPALKPHTGRVVGIRRY